MDVSTSLHTVEVEKERGENSESTKDTWRECAIQRHQDRVWDLQAGYAGFVECQSLCVYRMEMSKCCDTSQTSPHVMF